MTNRRLEPGTGRLPWGDAATPGGSPSHYPADLEHLVTLGDGSCVRIRPIRPDDQDGLIDLYGRLSQQTAYQRFFTVMRRLPPDWAKILANIDYRRRLALVAEHEGPSGVELIGVGRYEPTEREDTAEVAFVVQDGWQGKGLGTRLLHDILNAAGTRGVHSFRAWVLADNSRMLDLLSRFTDIQDRKIEGGIVGVTFTERRTGAADGGPAPRTPPP